MLRDLEGQLTRDGEIQRASVRLSKSREYTGRSRTLKRFLALCFLFIVGCIVLR